MGTFAGLIILGSLVTFACRSIYRDKKAGKSTCGGDCCHCRGCH